MIEPVKLGDDVTLYCGDCLEILPQLQAGSVDLTVTSPPYDNLRTYNGYVFNFEGIAQELYRVTKPGGVVVWVVGDATENGSETGTSFRQALYFKEIGFNLFDTMIYEKAGALVVGNIKQYRQIFEYMFIFTSGKPTTINLIDDKQNIRAGKKAGKTGTRKQDGTHKTKLALFVKEHVVRNNIWRIHCGNNGDDYTGHPAVFPEALARDHILSWSNEGDTILDSMMGSGTTGKMATKYNRRFIGVEISEQYFDIAVKRIKEAQLQMRMELNV